MASSEILTVAISFAFLVGLLMI